MSYIITGDTHGTYDIQKTVRFFEGKEDEFTKDDYLMICGDTGICGFNYLEEKETRSILKGLPVTTLFIDGNHENFVKLNSYDVSVWNGGKVHIIDNDIIHLMRGQVFNIDGTSFFTFGGAYSIDRMYRTIGETWFPDEIPNEEEYREGWANLTKNDFKVDYILSHTGPCEIVSAMGYSEASYEETQLRRFLQRVADNTDFITWYFGHFHEDTQTEEQFVCLYNDIIIL